MIKIKALPILFCAIVAPVYLQGMDSMDVGLALEQERTNLRQEMAWNQICQQPDIHTSIIRCTIAGQKDSYRLLDNKTVLFDGYTCMLDNIHKDIMALKLVNKTWNNRTDEVICSFEEYRKNVHEIFILNKQTVYNKKNPNYNTASLSPFLNSKSIAKALCFKEYYRANVPIEDLLLLGEKVGIFSGKAPFLPSFIKSDNFIKTQLRQLVHVFDTVLDSHVEMHKKCIDANYVCTDKKTVIDRLIPRAVGTNYSISTLNCYFDTQNHSDFNEQTLDILSRLPAECCFKCDNHYGGHNGYTCERIQYILFQSLRFQSPEKLKWFKKLVQRYCLVHQGESCNRILLTLDQRIAGGTWQEPQFTISIKPEPICLKLLKDMEAQYPVLGELQGFLNSYAALSMQDQENCFIALLQQQHKINSERTFIEQAFRQGLILCLFSNQSAEQKVLSCLRLYQAYKK